MLLFADDAVSTGETVDANEAGREYGRVDKQRNLKVNAN